MKRAAWSTWVLGAAVVITVVALAWAFIPPSGSAPSPKTLSDGGVNGVEFEATWNETRDGVLLFFVRIETHSVDLAGFDPLSQVVLEPGDQSLSPTDSSRIESRSSHHIAAELRFSTGATHDSVVLIAKDLAGVPERRLVFEA